MSKGTPAGAESALSDFQAAVERDPAFALAWVGVARRPVGSAPRVRHAASEGVMRGRERPRSGPWRSESTGEATPSSPRWHAL